MRSFAATICAVSIAFMVFSVSAIAAPKSQDPTHKQTASIHPTHEGKPIALNTFCLDDQGNILACVGGTFTTYVPTNDGGFESKTIERPALLQRYSPEGELLQKVKLDFKPTAINQAPNGSIFVAGDGKIAHLSEDGEVVTTIDSPYLGDLDALRKKAEADAKEQMESISSTFTNPIDRVKKSLERLKEKEEPTKRDLKRIDSLQVQIETFTDQKKMLEESLSEQFPPDSMLSEAKGITSLGVNSKYLFVCCNSGYGYDVWRMNHDFSDAKAVAEGLSGCCGQCDIQATEENLVLAENTKFQVGLLDLGGKRMSSFGDRARESDAGFGSCCNPMNVRCCSNGDILTAESSIGTIKRFDSNGEFVGVVGKARIGGGCKHVALGFDEKRDRYCIQYQDKYSICVLVSLAEAPEFTEAELKAKAAEEGLVKKLIGDGKTQSGYWSLDGKPVTESEPSPIMGLIMGLSDDSDNSDSIKEATTASPSNLGFSTKSFHFHSDGKLEMSGSMAMLGNEWEPVSQELDASSVRVSQLQDGVQFYDYNIQFIDDETAKFTMLYGDDEMDTTTYKRVPLELLQKMEAADSK